MNWLKKIFRKIKFFMGINVKFYLDDFEGISWEISTDEIHTIIQDAYTICVVFKKSGEYKTFPNTLQNRENLPNIRLAQEIKKSY